MFAPLLNLFRRDRTVTGSDVTRRRRGADALSAAQVLAITFLGLIAFGTLGLRFLPGLYTGDPLNWLDCLFTATSAVCVTGLVVVDTGTYFTPFGQAFILLLIQSGGLGILGLASLVIVTFNARLSLRQDVLVGGGSAVGAAANVPVRSLVRDVLIFTFVSEAIGFILLWILWAADPPAEGMAGLETAWHALFHSVSGFCNAGFSTFGDSLMRFEQRPFTQIVIMGGVMIGGIGFVTLEEMKLWVQARRRQRAFRLSLHSRLVLVTTVILVVAGAFLIGVLEWANPKTIGPLLWQEKICNAFFASIASRTAGFNTIDYTATVPATDFLTIVLMAIGGAPGGTAGGIKVTTVAIIVAIAYARFRGRPSADVWDRTLPASTATRAMGLFTFAFAALTGGIAMLTITELGTAFGEVQEIGASVASEFEFLDYMFEATSGFATTGLSTGPTATLSPSGRFLMVILMFVGRVGPLTFAAALSRHEPQQKLIRRFAYEDVVVG